MRMNGQTHTVTSLDSETGAVQIRRLHPKISNYNAVCLFLFRCNMDIKFIGSGQSAKALMFYITDYVTKNDLPLHESLSALAYVIKQAGTVLEEVQEGDSWQAVTRFMNAVISRREVSQAQVATELLGYGSHYSSGTYAVLRWGSFDRLFQYHNREAEQSDYGLDRFEDGQLLDVDSPDEYKNLTIGTETITSTNQQQDYMFRPADPAFESLSLWEFVAWTVKQTLSYEQRRLAQLDGRHTGSGRRPLPRGLFCPPHRQANTHFLRRRDTAVFPVLLGPTVPRRDSSDHDYETWCRVMLILFRPWRLPCDLRSVDEPWSSAFERTEFSAEVLTVMDNIAVQRECQSVRDEYSAAKRRNKSGPGMMTGPSVSFPVEPSVSFNDLVMEDSSLEDSSDSDFPYQCALTADVMAAVNAAQTVIWSAQVRPEETVTTIDDLAGDVTGLDRREINHLRTVMIEARRDKRPHEDSSTEPFQRRVRRCLNDRSPIVDITHHEEASNTPQDIPVGAGMSASLIIEDILRERNMLNNPEQTRAVRLIADHILTGDQSQLLMYVGGVAGTGKSYVVSTIVQLFERLG
ncbi:hypothetical protein CALVIDRAFT_454650, partial [Calocera viscosa TUFC12733]